jgi:5-methylcytosine-specific restriction endonuclease McrA
MPNKQCTACKQIKLLTEYSPSKRGGLGVQAKCKPCYAEIMRARRLANPTAHRESVKKSTAKHYDKKLERNSAYRMANPDKVSAWKRNDRTLNKSRVHADNAMRRTKLSGQLTPEIKQIYALRDFYKAMSLGENFHVDHIVPIAKGGLHISHNLQILEAKDNLRKGVKE